MGAFCALLFYSKTWPRQLRAEQHAASLQQLKGLVRQTSKTSSLREPTISFRVFISSIAPEAGGCPCLSHHWGFQLETGFWAPHLQSMFWITNTLNSRETKSIAKAQGSWRDSFPRKYLETVRNQLNVLTSPQTIPTCSMWIVFKYSSHVIQM